VTHVFVDEVHERDLQTDFTLIVLRDLLVRRPDIKVMMMMMMMVVVMMVMMMVMMIMVVVMTTSH
jgi:hypothetical protein